jgi:hypothetical protein
MPADRFIHPKLGHSAKVSHLSDFDYRVWTQYLLSADDFGVMRASAVTLQADNDAIEARPVKAVERALQHIIDRGLVLEFAHQGKRFIFQPDWQKWQKVEYPRATDNPQLTAEALEQCDPATRELFGKHPGGNGKKKTGAFPEDSPNVPQMIPESSPPTRAGAPAKRLTANANGYRLEADGGGDSDEQASQLMRAYPPQGAASIHAVTAALRDVLRGQPAGSFDALLERLEGHKRSAKWQEQGGRFIPRLDRYLTSGTHNQIMPSAEAVEREAANKKLPAWARDIA